jgi:hypothetical protein
MGATSGFSAMGRRRFEQPPGWIVYSVLIVAFLGLADAVSAPGAFVFEAAVFGMLWLVLGVVWLVRLAGFLFINRDREKFGSHGVSIWFRWAVGPALALLAIGMVMDEAPMRLRFAMSRGAMTALARHAAGAGPTPLRHEWYEAPVQRAGAFDVAIVQVGADGEVDFHVPGTELFRSFGGFTYSPGGAPYDPEGSYEPLGQDWYVWHTSW